MLKVKPLFELKKEVKELSKEDTVKKLLDLVSLVSELDKKEKPNNNAKVVEKAFVKYLALGLGLGYTLADILNAYDQKNQVNHQRQETNY
jgi:dimeric dUTPase (all-alpha-NTP-PPase superfamily)